MISEAFSWARASTAMAPAGPAPMTATRLMDMSAVEADKIEIVYSAQLMAVDIYRYTKRVTIRSSLPEVNVVVITQSDAIAGRILV